MKIDVLGTPYDLQIVPPDTTELKNNNADGLCNPISKTILISDFSDVPSPDREGYQKAVKRHELIHAFLNESGLQSSWEHEKYGQEETVVDWFALQFPKLHRAFEIADAL